jgi:7-cyano-7-deazaguanine reductase
LTHNLSQLGQQVAIASNPAEALIEVVPNPQTASYYVARFTVPEFTSLCPVTGQPDFARFVIDYVPGSLLIESKSLKLFLASFRNHAAFHEDCTVNIGWRLYQAAAPVYIRVCGFWYPRGGIPIDVFWQEGQKPKNVYLPEPGVAPYAGR